jgi:hypothetical protein
MGFRAARTFSTMIDMPDDSAPKVVTTPASPDPRVDELLKRVEALEEQQARWVVDLLLGKE